MVAHGITPEPGFTKIRAEGPRSHGDPFTQRPSVRAQGIVAQGRTRNVECVAGYQVARRAALMSPVLQGSALYKPTGGLAWPFWAQTPHHALRTAPLAATTRLFSLRVPPKPPRHAAVSGNRGEKMPVLRSRCNRPGTPPLRPLLAQVQRLDKTACFAVSQMCLGRLHWL
jgi:hypothetical protein